MDSRNLISILLFVVVFAAVMPSSASGGSFVVYSRPLIVDQNLNNLGGNYSNSALDYDSSQGVIFGGDFMLGDTTIVNQLSLWVVGTQDVGTNPGFEWSGLDLYVGDMWGLATALSTAYYYTPVAYGNGANYLSHQGTGIFYQVWKITFLLQATTFQAGTPYVFGWTGTPLDPAWYENIHTTNDCGNTDWTLRTGICAESSLDLLAPGGGGYTYAGWLNEDAAGRPIGYVNVELVGEVVPEPATFLSIGFGLGALGLVRRRRISAGRRN